MCRDGAASAVAESVSIGGERKRECTEWGGCEERGCPGRVSIGCVCMEKQGCLCLLCREEHVSPSFCLLGSCGLPLLHVSVCTCGEGTPEEPRGWRSELLWLDLAAGKVFRGSRGWSWNG